MAAGAASAIAMILNASPAERGLERVGGPLAFGALIAGPGVLTLLSRRDRPQLLLPAASVLVLASLLSFAGVLLPLLIPAGVLFASCRRENASAPVRRGTAALACLFVLVMFATSVAALLAGQQERSFTDGRRSYGTSNVVTVPEAFVSLAATAIAIAGAWVITSPPARRPG